MVPHYPQSSPGVCLPACVRMVLAAMGLEISEEEAARRLKSYRFGTPAGNVRHLENYGFSVSYASIDEASLSRALQLGRYPIVFVAAEFLPGSEFAGFHAMVLVQIVGRELVMMDPAQPRGHTQITRDDFLLAWEEFDCRAAIISRQGDAGVDLALPGF